MGVEIQRLVFRGMEQEHFPLGDKMPCLHVQLKFIPYYFVVSLYVLWCSLCRLYQMLGDFITFASNSRSCLVRHSHEITCSPFGYPGEGWGDNASISTVSYTLD